MSGAVPEQEPSIEEILASIRQIISDDDDQPPAPAAPAPEPAPVVAAPPPPPPAPVAPPPAPEPVAPPPPAPVPPKPPVEDVLELTDPLPMPEMPVIDLEDSPSDPVPEPEDEFIDTFISPEPDPLPPPPPAPEPKPVPLRAAPEHTMDSILGDAARTAAMSGFSRLSNNMNMDRGTTPHVSSGGSTLEDIVRDMLNPMLRAWLDDNLPGIIEKLVQKELDKLARRAMDD